MHRLALIACFAALAATPVQADPSYWKVTGVAAGDTLNVRSNPSADAADIGDLPPDAVAIEVDILDATGDWGRIVWEAGNGWLAMRYLAADPQATIAGTALPAGLLCTGSEPFWSLRLSSGSATYSDLDGGLIGLSQTGSSVAEGRPAFPVQLSHGAPTAASLTLIAPQACSDGMSDRIYPWRADFLLNTAAGGRYLTGCCQLPLEAGLH